MDDIRKYGNGGVYSKEDYLSKTLFDWKIDRRLGGEDDRKTLLHRMAVVCKMSHNDFSEIGQYYEKFFKDMQSQLQTEGVTGMLLLYPKHCVQVIEGSVEVLLEFVRDLKRMADTHEGPMEKSKILIVSHDIPHRLYQHWSFRMLDIEAPNIEEYEPTDISERMVSDMLTQLLKLGMYLARQPKVSLKNAMDSLHDKVPELLPQQVVIGYLLENDEKCIMEPEEYLAKYEKPFDVVLGTDLTWPMPVDFFPTPTN